MPTAKIISMLHREPHVETQTLRAHQHKELLGCTVLYKAPVEVWLIIYVPNTSQPLATPNLVVVTSIVVVFTKLKDINVSLLFDITTQSSSQKQECLSYLLKGLESRAFHSGVIPCYGPRHMKVFITLIMTETFELPLKYFHLIWIIWHLSRKSY